MPDKPRKIAVYPGAFDPITLGHVDIIERAACLFEEVVVAVGINPEKTACWFTPHERVQMIRETVGRHRNVRTESYDGLTMDYVRQVAAKVLVRGIRDTVDLREELQIASVNRLVGGVETVFLMSDDRYGLTSSTLIKQIVEMGGFDVERLGHLVPPTVIEKLAAKLGVQLDQSQAPS